MRHHGRNFVGWFGGGLILALAASGSGDESSLEDFLRDEMAAGQLAGLAAVVVLEADIAWETGLGWAEIGARPVTAHTPFLVASVSKPVTATLVQAAAEDGLLALDEDVRQAFGFPVGHPFFPDAPLTARQLLAHASSIVDDRARLAAAIAPGDPTLSLEEFLVSYLPPGDPRGWATQAPQTVFAYSNVGYTLAGHLVERRSGEAFASYSARRLFAPLGMTDSAWTLAALPTAAALPYRVSAGGFEAYEPYGAPYAPAVLLRTSAHDLGRFLAFHLAGGRVGDTRVLAEAAVAEMQRVPFATSGQQALGWRYLYAGGRLVLGHGGSGSGVTALIVLDRVRGRGVAVLTNVDATAGPAARSFQAIVDRLMSATDFPSPVEPAPEPRSWWLPSVVRGHRGGAAEYRTDLWLVNRNAEPVLVEMAYRPRGLALPPAAIELTLAPGEGREVEDVILSRFGLVAGQGAVVVTTVPSATAPAPAVTTLARIGEPGGPGQWVPAEEIAVEIAGENAGVVTERWVAGVHHGDGFQATVAVSNVDPRPRTVAVAGWDAAGEPVGAAVLELPAAGFRSLRLDALLPATTRGGGPFALHFRGAGRFLASATVLELGSGDPFFLAGQGPAPEVGSMLVPRAVRGRGQRGATLTTELAIHNPSDSPLEVRVELWRRGQDNSVPASAVVSLGPRGTRIFGDVLEALFGLGATDAAGALVLSRTGEGPAPVVSVLGFARGAGGRLLGTTITARGAGGGGHESVFGAGWGAGRDSSVGLVNESLGAVTVELTLLDAGGRELGRRAVPLGRRQHFERTLPGVFGALAPGRGWTVTARVVGGGAVTLYLASLDAVGDVDFLVGGPAPPVAPGQLE